MTPSDMTVWDRLHLLFPTCTSDEIRDWYGEKYVRDYHYDIQGNLIAKKGHRYVDEQELRAAIDATKPKPWHVVAQEALADWASWNQTEGRLDPVSNAIRYCDRGQIEYMVTEKGIYVYTSVDLESAYEKHNEIASLLRAAGLTQFKTYKLVEDTEQ